MMINLGRLGSVFQCVVLLVVLSSPIASAESNPKIKIMPKFLNLPDNYRGNIINKPQDLEKIVFERLKKKIGRKFVLEFEDLNEDEIWFFFLTAPLPINPKHIGADYFFMGIFNGGEGLLNLTLISVKTIRSIEASIDLKQPLKRPIADEITDIVLRMFSDVRRVNELTTINGGAIIDAYNSVVQYQLKTIEEKDLRLNFNYDGGHHWVQDHSFQVFDVAPDSNARLTLACEDGYVIDLLIGADMKVGSQKGISVNFYPENHKEITREFLVKSKNNEEIVFQFSWKDRGLIGVKIYPKVNPFDPLVYKVS